MLRFEYLGHVDPTLRTWEVFRFEGLRKHVVGLVPGRTPHDAVRTARTAFPEQPYVLVRPSEE